MQECRAKRKLLRARAVSNYLLSLILFYGAGKLGPLMYVLEDALLLPLLLVLITLALAGITAVAFAIVDCLGLMKCMFRGE